jgi:hypothetical protein
MQGCEYIWPSLKGVSLASQKLTSLIQQGLMNEIKKRKSKNRINKLITIVNMIIYTLSRKRFLPTVVFNSGNVSSSFKERRKKELKGAIGLQNNRVITKNRFLSLKKAQK